MDELYKKYGQLAIQLEIIQGKMNDVKRQIADSLNKQAQPKEEEQKDGANT